VYLGRLLGYLMGDRDPAYAHDPEHGSHGHGEHSHGEIKETSWAIRIVLSVLIVAALGFGFLSALPSFMGHGTFYSWVTNGQTLHHGPSVVALVVPWLLTVVLFAAVFLGYRSVAHRQKLLAITAKWKFGEVGPLTHKWYFDDLYAVAVVAPLKGISWILRILFETVFMGVLGLFGFAAEGISWMLRRFQTGKTHQYALGVLVFATLFALILFQR
jgi:NADH-quinone oxidoreductase subunit L